MFHVDFSRLFTVVVLPACFLFGRSAPAFRSSPSIVSALPVIASLLASFALARRRNCSCFCFSPSIVSALLVTRSASVRRLFLLFSSINISSR